MFPAAARRSSESEFQRRLLSTVIPPGSHVPRVDVYETPSAFASVVEFYERRLGKRRVAVQRFAVASRLRQLADGARRGGSQQIAVGRLLFGRATAPTSDSLDAVEIADSLSALSDRLADVEGMIAIARVPLATSPPSTGLVSIERPHLDASSLSVDSLTVITIAVQTARGGAR